jgi:hypothetical protein
MDQYYNTAQGSSYHFGPTVTYNFIQHCFFDLRSHFEALESVLLIFFLLYASKKYDQTDSCAPKCLPRVTKTVMYIVNIPTPIFFKHIKVDLSI